MSSETSLLGWKNFKDVHESHAVNKPPLVYKTFDKLDKAGTVIDYRCKDCRNCQECKKSDRLESISIQEELEQDIIENCVILDTDKGRTIAKLPFLSNPLKKLQNNREMALKVYQSQVRKLHANPTDLESVKKSENKLHELGFC